MIAREARITEFFFLVEQISSDGHNMKIEEGFESKINKKLTIQQDYSSMLKTIKQF